MQEHACFNRLVSCKTFAAILASTYGDYRMNKVLFDYHKNVGHGWLEIPDRMAEKIAAYLAAINRPDAINNLVPITAGERDLLYQDPDLGFCILLQLFRSNRHHDALGPFMHKCAAKQMCEYVWYNKLPITHRARSLLTRPIKCAQRRL